MHWSEEFDRIIRAHCGLPDSTLAVNPNSSFNQLGADSVGLLNIIVDSEELFRVDFPDELMTADVLATPGALWQALLSVREQSGDAGGGPR